MTYVEDDPEVPLLGGDVTKGLVRTGTTVRRPVGPGSGRVQRLLEGLERAGFDGAPRHLGVDGAGRDVLTFIAIGDVILRRQRWLAGNEAALRSAVEREG